MRGRGGPGIVGGLLITALLAAPVFAREGGDDPDVLATTLESVTVAKEAPEGSFDLTLTNLDTGEDMGTKTVPAGESRTWEDTDEEELLEPGTYRLVEAIPDGWELLEVTCSGAPAEPVVDEAGALVGVDFQLDEAGSVSCIFTDAQAVPVPTLESVTVAKEAPEGSFDLTLTNLDTGEDMGTKTVPAGESRTWEDTDEEELLEPGTYRLVETVPEGWELRNVTCSGDVEDETELLEDGALIGVEFVLAEPAVTCTFTNARPAPPPPPEIDLAVEKTNDASGDGAFNDVETFDGLKGDVTFQATISNLSGVDVVLTTITDAFGPTEIGVCSSLVGTVLAADASVACQFTLEGYAPSVGTQQTNTLLVEAAQASDQNNADFAQDTSVVNFVKILASSTTTTTTSTTQAILPVTGPRDRSLAGTGLAMIILGWLLLGLGGGRAGARIEPTDWLAPFATIPRR